MKYFDAVGGFENDPNIDAIFERMPRERKYGYPYNRLPIDMLGALATYEASEDTTHQIVEDTQRILYNAFDEFTSGDNLRVSGKGLCYPENTNSLFVFEGELRGVFDAITVMNSPLFEEFEQMGTEIDRAQQTPAFILKDCRITDSDKGPVGIKEHRMVFPLNSLQLKMDKIVVPEAAN